MKATSVSPLSIYFRARQSGINLKFTSPATKKHVGLWLTTIFGAFTSFWVFELAHPILALHIFFPEPTVSFNLQEPGLYWNPEFCLLLFVHPHLMFITICCGLSFPS